MYELVPFMSVFMCVCARFGVLKCQQNDENTLTSIIIYWNHTVYLDIKCSDMKEREEGISPFFNPRF